MSALAARFPSRDQVGSFLSWRRLPVLIAFGCIIFAFAYVLFIAKIPSEFGTGDWRTTNFGSAVHDPSSFLKIVPIATIADAVPKNSRRLIFMVVGDYQISQ